MEVFKELSNAFYINTDKPFFATSGNQNGCVALAFETEKYAKKFITNQKEGFKERGIDVKKISLAPVGNVIEYMQACAKNGLAGIELLGDNERKSFVFGSDLDEISATLPTALIYNLDGKSYIKSSAGEYVENEYTTVTEWKRFDLLDPNTSTYATKQPFANWSHKLIFEIRTSDGGVLCLFKVPCRGNYNGIVGSIPFFSSLDLAIEFIHDEDYMRHLANYGGIKSKFKTLAADISKTTKEYQIIQIDDLKKRLQEINIGSMDYVINPNSTRDETGYGSCPFNKTKEAFYTGISGTWEIGAKNQFKKLDLVMNSKKDLFYWNSMNSFDLKPLKKSFSSESKSTIYSNSNVKEVNKLVEDIFSKSKFKKTETAKLITKVDSITKEENYILIWWDAITGEGQDKPVYFKSIFNLIQWLWHYECSTDAPIRINGSGSYNGNIGVVRALDLDAEQNKHEIIKTTLTKIFKRIALKGYTPMEGDNLSGLINLYFKTRHVDLIAYLKDANSQTKDGKKVKR